MISRVAFSPTFMVCTPSSQPVNIGTVRQSASPPVPDHMVGQPGETIPLMTWPIPMLTTKSPRPTEESNLEVGGRCRGQHIGTFAYHHRSRLVLGAAHLEPLPLGWLVSLSHPVYSMVTLSPFFGMAPVPSSIIVLVTPIVMFGIGSSCDSC